MVEGATKCPFPRAEFLLNDGQKVRLLTNSLLIPSLRLSLTNPQLLSSGQYYSISLQLLAPESPVNEAVGVFMVNITLYTTGQQFLSTSARPVRHS